MLSSVRVMTTGRYQVNKTDGNLCNVATYFLLCPRFRRLHIQLGLHDNLHSTYDIKVAECDGVVRGQARKTCAHLVDSNDEQLLVHQSKHENNRMNVILRNQQITALVNQEDRGRP